MDTMLHTLREGYDIRHWRGKMELRVTLNKASVVYAAAPHVAAVITLLLRCADTPAGIGDSRPPAGRPRHWTLVRARALCDNGIDTQQAVERLPACHNMVSVITGRQALMLMAAIRWIRLRWPGGRWRRGD